MAKTFEEMAVWQKARKLCEEVYMCVQTVEFSRDYELKNQINRSSGSVMVNIAEGFERNNNKEFIISYTFQKVLLVKLAHNSIAHLTRPTLHK